MRHKKYRGENNCLNCGTQVVGRFCHQCGQENLDTRENFFHMVGHFIADYLHFDSKFFRSLVPLFTKPGFLTKEYWAGRRVHYIHPLRLFFFITIIFMISTSYFYKKFGDDLKSSITYGDTTLLKFDSDNLSGLHDSTWIALPNGKDSITVADVKHRKAGEERRLKKVYAGIDFVFTNLKYVTFFLLPVYALIFKLIFIRRKLFYVDHLVYAMHLQTFAYLVFSVILLLPFILPASLELIRKLSVLIIFIYILFSFRYLYRQVWWKTVLKSVLATISLSFVTGLTIMLIAFIDAIFIQ